MSMQSERSLNDMIVLRPPDFSLTKPQMSVLYALGRSLRHLYANTIEEGVPEHLQRYIEQLEGKVRP